MKFRLATVLRARKAQERAAQAEAAKARVEEQAAEAVTRKRRRELADRELPAGQKSAAFAAAVWARQALAGSLNDAIALAANSRQARQDRVDQLAGAAARRRALELLAERHTIQQRQAEDAAERAVLDDLAGSTFHRGRKP